MANKSDKTNTNKKISKGVDAASRVARKGLQSFGSLLDNLNAKSGKASQFKAVDLSQYKNSNANNLLSQQTLKTSQQLLGNRFTTYSKYAKKIVPDSMFQKASDGVFSQVAKLAATWSEIDLSKDQRLQGIQGLSDQERNALARDIANQNRALATLGGVTGLAGLPGMLADTLWLLLVSLRTVYQLATVYDKPLTGKQGVKMAYAVLGSADLSKMQEKQTILAALGVAKGLVNSADNNGLRSELTQGLGVISPNVQFYAQQVDKLAEQFNFDMDNINLTWIGKFLPVVSVATTVHYNSHLIDQVIGVAKATFGPEPILAKQALTDNSSSEETADEKSDNADQKKEDKGAQKEEESATKNQKDKEQEKAETAKKDSTAKKSEDKKSEEKSDKKTEAGTKKKQNETTDKDQSTEEKEQSKSAKEEAGKDQE